MKPSLTADFRTSDNQDAVQPASPAPQEGRSRRDAPRRRLHPMLVAFFAFGTASCSFYGAEMLAPPVWRPSVIIGGYERQITQARKTGELAAQIRYDGQLKQIETAAVQWQEQYKAAANGVLEYYKTTYSRANVYAQATADIQKQYAATRYQIAQQSVGGEIGVANMATTLGLLGGLIDPAFGASAQSYADDVRRRAYAKLDEAARSGITVSVDGWNTGLASPAEVASALRDLPPMKFPSSNDTAGAPAVRAGR